MDVIREWLDHGNSILVLPGWRNSGPQHWQTRWEQVYPDMQRVQQQNWEEPVAANWVRNLQLAVDAAPGRIILVAHSLGCITQHHWSVVNRHAARRVVGALLVAPADPVREGLAGFIQGFLPLPLLPLPYHSIVVGSDNDPVCRPERTSWLARTWGSQALMLEGAGHINADSALGDWSFGQRQLRRLIRSALGSEAD